MAKILIMGDTVPTTSNFKLFSDGTAEELVGAELAKICREADYRILNLETPLTDDFTPISKWGVNLSAPTSTIRGIKALAINYAGLANNHIMDQGEKGFFSTIHLLQENGISFSNVGNNILEAEKGKIVTIDGLKVGIYACVEHEFSCADENKAGANPFEPMNIDIHIRQMKKECDYLLVLYHGGKEHYRYPTPYLRKACRRFVESGADLVICQHSHCVGCKEQYQKGTIVYGQGNFIFDYLQEECWQDGVVVEWSVSKEKSCVNYIPIVRDNNRVVMASLGEGRKILDEFQKRSEQIIDQGFLSEKFDELCRNNFNSYIYAIKQGIPVQCENHIRCETHREILLRGICLEQENRSRILRTMFSKKIVIWGTGNYGNVIYKSLYVNHIDIFAFCDNDRTKWGSTKYGIKIITPQELSTWKKEDYLIIVATIYENEIEEQLLNMGFRQYYLLSDLRGRILDL